jgi:hypothetical protein
VIRGKATVPLRDMPMAKIGYAVVLRRSEEEILDASENTVVFIMK